MTTFCIKHGLAFTEQDGECLCCKDEKEEKTPSLFDDPEFQKRYNELKRKILLVYGKLDLTPEPNGHVLRRAY